MKSASDVRNKRKQQSKINSNDFGGLFDVVFIEKLLNNINYAEFKYYVIYHGLILKTGLNYLHTFLVEKQIDLNKSLKFCGKV